jgi:Tol biopolymer transport system component
MNELREVFEMVTKQIEPDQDSWKEQEKQQQRSARHRKIGALAVAAVILAAIALFAANALNDGKDGSAPATVVPSGPEAGVVFTVVGTDGSVRSDIFVPVGTVHADVSPDGTRVAFVIATGGNSQIATMLIDGTEVRTITGDPIYADWPRWSPDGSQLLFYEGRDLATRRLMVMDADGANIAEIPGTRHPVDVPADWSPDGSLILYTSFGPGERDVAVLPAAGGASHLLAHAPFNEGPASWSPDGSQIAFMRWEGSGAEVWVMDADGSGQHRVASLPGVDAKGPEWSTDGSLIAFIGVPRNTDLVTGTDDLYVVDVVTGEVATILREVALWTSYDTRPSWLPGGDSLLVMTETP